MITAGICNSYINELPQGLHNHAVGGDVFKIALYRASASIGPSTAAFTVVNEVTGVGYTSGGEVLTNVTPVLSDSTSIMDWADVVFSTVTITGVAGALIYNSTNGNRAVAVLKFTSTVNPTAQDLTIEFPGATVLSGILRITNNG